MDYGKIIAFEGIDGAGKTTQANLTAEWLNSKKLASKYLKEPTNSINGKKIQESAKNGRFSENKELNLFLEDRKWNVETNINPALNSGLVVLLDRYYYSTIAYQGARGLEPDDIRKKNEAFAPRPDLVLLLDLDPEIALERIKKNRGETPNLFEKLDYLKRVREIFLSLKDPNIVTIDAAGTVEQVWQQVLTALKPLFPQITPP